MARPKVPAKHMFDEGCPPSRRSLNPHAPPPQKKKRGLLFHRNVNIPKPLIVNLHRRVVRVNNRLWMTKAQTRVWTLV
ncbi:hypothetical protein H5410_057034 [Solanum commersonii]|uniref:Uncharacterized protein n=1 Tax=Solanum commersonii TaxID=4109 RepID=A0A9J5WNZ0_SOLCO|nr:hypothetical protein H5410_057034 [Solanum commersonii]